MAALANSLKSRRGRRGLTQEELAGLGGISRQALHAIERGRAVPSTAVALALASALGCTVEDLFWIDGRPAPIFAELAAPGPRGRGPCRVALAEIAGKWIAHPLLSCDAPSLRTAADGLRLSRAAVEPLRSLPELRQNLVVVGCDLALGVLAARAAERFSDLRLVWIQGSSERALELLARGHAHLAGAHLLDEQSGDFNVPFVRRRFPDRSMAVVTLARWESGLALAPGNPRHVRGVRDLAARGLRIINREVGAGARALLDRKLRAARLPGKALEGYQRIARGHLEVAQAVALGVADAGVVPRAVAEAHALSFLPLDEERFDLVLPLELTQDARVARLLEILRTNVFRREVSALPGYDATRAGHLVAEPGRA